nr:hypothetical protein [Tanacetum cinerariifolium]
EKRIQKIDRLAILKKCGYSKDKCELNFKFLNNLQPEWKQYETMMRQNKNLMEINIDAIYNILKQTKEMLMMLWDQRRKLLCELKKITALLAKAFDRRKFYSKPTNNNLRTSSTSQSANKKQEFVKIDNKKVKKKDDEKKRDMSRVKCYNCKKEGHFAKDCKKVKVKDYEYYKTKMFLAKKDKDEQVLLAEDQAWMESSKSESEYEFETLEYYDNSTNYGLFVNNDDDQEVFHDAIESANENFIENHIDSQKDYDKSDVDHNDFEEKYHLVDNYVNEKINSEDDYFQDIINPDFKKIDSPFQQTSSLKPYVPNVILEKIIIDLENKVVSLLEKEKENLETIESLKSKGFESSENVSSESENQTENDCLVVEKECHKEENPKVIAPGMFNLNVSQCVSPISMSKSSCNSKNVEIKFKRKRHLDTFSSVRRPKNSGAFWKKKRSSNNSNVVLSAVSDSKLHKNVKRYSRKDLLACNNSNLGETSSASVCNDAMNVSCNSSMCDLLDDNNFFIIDDESVKISPVSKMPFRKKPRDSMHVRSKSTMNKSLPKTMHKWLPKLQPLAEPVAKWLPRVKHCPDLSLDHRFRMFKTYDG